MGDKRRAQIAAMEQAVDYRIRDKYAEAGERERQRHNAEARKTVKRFLAYCWGPKARGQVPTHNPFALLKQWEDRPHGG